MISIILIIAAIAIPKMNNQLMAAHEMAAIRQVTTIHQAETQYYSQFGKYADTLIELGPPASGAASPAAADLIPKVLADGKDSGFVFSVAATPTGYAVTAVPETFNSTGRRTFFSDQSLVIRNSWSQRVRHGPKARKLKVSVPSANQIHHRDLGSLPERDCRS